MNKKITFSPKNMVVIKNIENNGIKYGILYYDMVYNTICYIDKNNKIHNLLENEKNSKIESPNLNNLNYKENWTNKKSYNKNDIIKDKNNNIYICIQTIEKSEIEPENDKENWELLMSNMKFCGEWVNNEYIINNIVLDPYDNNIYKCINNHNSYENPVFDKMNWELLIPKLEDIKTNEITNINGLFFSQYETIKLEMTKNNNILIIPLDEPINIDYLNYDIKPNLGINLVKNGLYEIIYNINFSTNFKNIMSRINLVEDVDDGISGKIISTSIHYLQINNENYNTINHKFYYYKEYDDTLVMNIKVLDNIEKGYLDIKLFWINIKLV